MTTVGILNPESLAGTELVRLLAGRPDVADEVKLLTSDTEKAGTLIDVGGEVALVTKFDADGLAGLDAVFLCGSEAESALAAIPDTMIRILVAPDRPPEGSLALVAGVNLQRADPSEVLVSPHPAVVACALLLHPLARISVDRAAAWVLQSASTHGRAGLDELYQQSLSVLKFQHKIPQEALGGRLAFNVVPSPIEGAALAADLRTILGDPSPTTAMTLFQAGIFHGMLASVHVTCAAETSLEDINEALGRGHGLRLVERADFAGLITALEGDIELVTQVEQDPQIPGGFWINGTLDNLILGGAANALAIAEALFATRQDGQPS